MDIPPMPKMALALLCGYKMPDRHQAEMYGVATKVLNQAVKKNHRRFSTVRCLPSAFTRQVVALRSSVLASETASQVNIQIIRVNRTSAGKREPACFPYTPAENN